jgi:hypothetical protein
MMQIVPIVYYQIKMTRLCCLPMRELRNGQKMRNEMENVIAKVNKTSPFVVK